MKIFDMLLKGDQLSGRMNLYFPKDNYYFLNTEHFQFDILNNELYYLEEEFNEFSYISE